MQSFPGWKKRLDVLMNKSRMNSNLKMLMALLRHHGWQAALYRWPCTDEHNPVNTAKTAAAMNAVVAWRPGKVRRVCWIWELECVSVGELVDRLEEKKEAA